MAKPASPATATEAQVRALLERAHGEVPFHAVRTRFLGAIASPDPRMSPVKAIEGLWGGRLPTFDSPDHANELLGALMALWNHLTRHQERSAPFRLTRIEAPTTREGVAGIARMREQELRNFRDGLFGDNASLDLPERTHEALGVLSQIAAMIEGIRELAENPAKRMTPQDSASLLPEFSELTRIAEVELHKAVLSRARARRDVPASRPVLH